MSVYITNNERYLLSHIDDRYDITLKDTYTLIIPAVAKQVFEDQDYDYRHTILLLDDIKTQIQKRLTTARSRHKSYELTSYIDWVQGLIDRTIHIQYARDNPMPLDIEGMKAHFTQLFASPKTSSSGTV